MQSQSPATRIAHLPPPNPAMGRHSKRYMHLENIRPRKRGCRVAPARQDPEDLEQPPLPPSRTRESQDQEQEASFLADEEEPDESEAEGGGEAENSSLQGYIDSLQVSDADSEPGPLPEQTAQTGLYKPGGAGRQKKPPSWPRISGLKRIEILKAGLADMKMLLLSARKRPTGADLTWHLQVQALICAQLANTGLNGRCTKTRSELSRAVAKRSLKKGYVAKRIASHEISWITKREIPKSYQGLHAKTICMLEDEGTLMAFEEYMTGEGKLATGPGLANAITEYWRSEGITNEDGSEAELADRTATEWMNRRGYKWADPKKGIYKDGRNV
ncbi:hypothetical protein FN846DRAFT_929236 [Sphaerosporella brunnea]|uniref:Uncharacterized protein n=1 Tax=Sphaerosporella brunnea TaxID=1250544 RepID=A0A5J5F9F1_9PEZI|nr:hypothetical protein FN846DRAFT_929236 [Sphaerosporella brunnea]